MSAYLRIAPNQRLTVVCGLSEMGQGVHTAIRCSSRGAGCRLVARAGRASGRSDQAFRESDLRHAGDRRIDLGARHWEPMPQAGATARAMLIGPPPAESESRRRRLSHRAGRSVIHKSGKKAFLRPQLPPKSGRSLLPPRTSKLKGPDTQFSLLGRAEPSAWDTVAKSTRKAKFGMDVYLPGVICLTHNPDRDNRPCRARRQVGLVN